MSFLLDIVVLILYPENMLNGIRVYSSDSVWRQILSELNATVTDDAKFADVNMDSLNLNLPISGPELKSIITNAMDNTEIIERVLGAGVTLSHLPTQIIVWLYKTGGMSAADLKIALGYAPNANTHTVDTAVCALRREYGREFIINENGIYKLGRI